MGLMITGSIRYVVVQLDDDENIIAIWGPFPNEQEALEWKGVPGRQGSYRTQEMHSAPQWFAEIDTDEEGD